MFNDEDEPFPKIKPKPHWGLQMSGENIYPTTFWVSSKLTDKVNLPPTEFSTGLFRCEVNL